MYSIGKAPANFKGSQSSFYKVFNFPMKANGWTNDIKQAQRFKTRAEAEAKAKELHQADLIVFRNIT